MLWCAVHADATFLSTAICSEDVTQSTPNLQSRSLFPRYVHTRPPVPSPLSSPPATTQSLAPCLPTRAPSPSKAGIHPCSAQRLLRSSLPLPARPPPGAAMQSRHSCASIFLSSLSQSQSTAPPLQAADAGRTPSCGRRPPSVAGSSVAPRGLQPNLFFPFPLLSNPHFQPVCLNTGASLA